MAQFEPEKDLLEHIKGLGLGRRQKAKDVFRYRQGSKDASSDIGATGKSVSIRVCKIYKDSCMISNA